MIARWFRLRIKPECRAEFLAAITEDAIGSERDEPGCARFNVFQDEADENVYYIHEVFRDEAALAHHRTTPHYQTWKAAAHMLDGAPERMQGHAVFPVDPAYWFRD